MLNYVRHDEEFYCSIKLTSGAEIMGRAMVTADEDNSKSLVYVQDPVEINIITTERGDGKAVRGMGFSRWMNFSDEDFFIIPEEHIITMASLGKEMIAMYEMFLLGEDDDKIKNADVYTNTVPTNSIMGSLGTIEEARKKFEQIFKNNL